MEENRTAALEQLAGELQAVNPVLTPIEALTWVEVLWEDFEATLARAGEKYQGEAVAVRFVEQQIKQHGAMLHRFNTSNEKFKHLMLGRDIQ
ncbi:YfhJ family protein [Exiguobacterium sp. s102]|uniref:YfhJ family protein n=1 Tax=Exiguobacterium sp. s102 TaxID=2751212 RepID=UPI001BEC14B4|nr:YfhJ family protein [Exiguobacterium sp. s102]